MSNKQTKSNIIILDGVGINLKSGLINYFRKLGYGTLESNSNHYRGNQVEALPRQFEYTVRFDVRFHEMCACLALQKSVYNFKPLFVDRGAVNQIIFSLMTYDNESRDNVFDDYFQNTFDRDTIRKNLDAYVTMENRLGVHRYLINTYSEKLLKHALDESMYEKDIHYKTRIDAFDCPEYYATCRKRYEQYYNQLFLNNGGFITIDITDELFDLGYDKMTEILANKILVNEGLEVNSLDSNG